MKKLFALIGWSIAAFGLLGCDGRMQDAPVPDAAVSKHQAQAFIEALRPRRSGRPVIAVIARNEGTETTDFLLPHAILKRGNVADVQAIAPRRGIVTLYPTLQVEVAQDFASFDRNHPSGADYVIVPAMDDVNDPAITTWLKQQAERGARIIGVCAGALVVGHAGLLDGRRFATHWYYVDTVLDRHPTATYVPHQRYVIDRDIATTTGITASLPTMLALIEAIGGREKAEVLADELGVESWTPAHDSSLFGLTAGRAASFLLNKAAFWRDEHKSVEVKDGTDDIALALVADAWTRTGHISVQATSASSRVKLRSGMQLITQPAAEGTARLSLSPDLNPTQQLNRTLCEIGERFGAARRKWVMMELEYAGAADCQL